MPCLWHVLYHVRGLNWEDIVANGKRLFSGQNDVYWSCQGALWHAIAWLGFEIAALGYAIAWVLARFHSPCTPSSLQLCTTISFSTELQLARYWTLWKAF